MSTKIYNAMVVPLNKFEEFIKLFHEKSILGAQNFLKNITKNMSNKESKKTIKEMYGEDCPEEFAISILAMRSFIESSKTSESGYNIDTWFNAWILNKKVYLYTTCDRFIPTYKDFPDWCKDFSYWNNTDPDESVSNKQWKNRGKIWDLLMDESPYKESKITHIVIEAKNLCDRGLLKVFSDIPKDKIYSIWSIAYNMEKKNVSKNING